MDKSEAENLQLTIGDIPLNTQKNSSTKHPNATAIALDVFNKKQRETEIKKADLVISMLPARFHIEVAKDCITFKKHMVTASYISRGDEGIR